MSALTSPKPTNRRNWSRSWAKKIVFFFRKIIIFNHTIKHLLNDINETRARTILFILRGKTFFKEVERTVQYTPSVYLILSTVCFRCYITFGPRNALWSHDSELVCCLRDKTVQQTISCGGKLNRGFSGVINFCQKQHFSPSSPSQWHSYSYK